MPVQPADAVCSGHRHAFTGWRKSRSACLSLHRARSGRRRLSNGFRAIQSFGLADDFRRDVRRGKRWWDDSSPLRGSRWRTLAVAFLISAFQIFPCRHQAAACAPLSRQVAARFRRTAGRTHRFASAPFAAASTSDGGRFRSFRRLQTTETVTDSGAPRKPEATMLRISAKTLTLARDASHGQHNGNSTARLRPVQGSGNNREIGHFRTAFISQATLRRTETTELTGKTKLV